MQKLADVLAQISTDNYWARTTLLLSGFPGDMPRFREKIRAQPEFQELLRRMKTSSVRKKVRDRALEFANTSANPYYQHPLDAAVSTCIVALDEWPENYAVDVANAVMESGRPWHFATELCRSFRNRWWPEPIPRYPRHGFTNVGW